MRIRGFNEKKQEWVIIEITDGGAMVGLENWYDIASCSVGVSTEKADMRGKEVFQTLKWKLSMDVTRHFVQKIDV